MTSIPSEAHDELEKLERKHAENPEGRYFVPLASLYRRLGDLERAESLLRQGLARHPDYLSAHIVLGYCLADRGDRQAAEAEFRYVLSLDSQNLVALRTMGELAAARGDVEESRRWYHELLQVDPMNEEARTALEALDRDTAGDREAGTVGDLSEGGAAAAAAGEAPADLTLSSAPTAADYEVLFGSTVQLDLPNELDEGRGGFLDAGDAVVTETIAELYTRQGFYQRAADVYRELIRRRGGDAGLEEKLRQVEAAATAPAQPAQPVGVVADAAAGEGLDDAETLRLERVGALEAATPDPFADSFVDGFPEDLPEAAAETPARPTIRAFLSELLAWTPSREETPEPAGAADSGEEPETAYDSQPALAEEGGPARGWGEPAGPSFSPVAEAADAEAAPAGEHGPLDSREAEAASILDALEADLQRAVASGEDIEAADFPAAVEDDELFPWELPTGTIQPSPGDIAPDAGDTGAEDLPPGEEPPSVPPADAVTTPGAAAVDAAEPLSPPSSSDHAAEEDDDLESFQAWLRSLKR